MITVGAPSAHSLRFKGGGLHRLLSAVNPAEISSSDMLTDSMGKPSAQAVNLFTCTSSKDG